MTKQAMPADIGSTNNPKPVLDKLIDFDVAPIVTILCTVFKKMFRVFNFFDFLFGLLFSFLKYVIISFILILELIKLRTSIIFPGVLVLNLDRSSKNVQRDIIMVLFVPFI